MVTVAGKLEVRGQDSVGTAFLVSSGGAVARFENTVASMQLFIDATAGGNEQASFQLRKVGSTADNRTLFARLFSGHSSSADFLNIQHIVGGNTVCLLTVTGAGDLRLLPNGGVGIGVTVPKTKLHGTGSTIVGAAAAPVANGDLGNGQVNISVDETNHTLVFKVKYSNGTVKSGTVALS